ncbi:DUF3095 domain-containing protein [Pseudahrensia aquimaris]|uniref:DUF3095 domain-containing protein n=1 Tax=Pseudahrensia aquimaris TaxID=744461 RepID=A0ABW3FIX7_9HYPH
MIEVSYADFYSRLPRFRSFAELTDSTAYSDIPDGWFLGIADVVGSTEAIKAGAYKTVNMVGAAVISAQVNTLQDVDFPYIFGGDGATFCVPPAFRDASAQQLSAVRQWAMAEFGLKLRIALIPMDAIHQAGHTVSVARYAVSESVDYAMFRGSGSLWAEQQLKAGAFALPTGGSDTYPDLTGLSCRWSAMRSKNGTVLSIVIIPETKTDPFEYDKFAGAFVELVSQTERGSTPVPEEGPGVSWPPEGLALEAHASHGTRSMLTTKIRLLAETFVAWVFIKARLKIGGFDSAHYQRTTGLNADFQKFEQSLKMTLDCNEAVKQQIITMLDEAQHEGIIRYGIHEQDTSIMTCIVPSIMSDDHIHFVDGANGGYAAATRTLKEH